MRRLNNLTDRSPTPRRGGFTLVEMLAVVTLIALLIGILIPAVSKVRTMAKVTATKAAIAALETGLQTLKIDTRFGGGFAPSSPDGDGKDGRPEAGWAADPFGDSKGKKIEVSGAGLLVWALAGADLLGPPGFRVFDTSKSTAWAQDTHNASGGAYELDDDRQPLKARSSPYVDLDKVAISTFNAVEKSFEIPAELKAREALGRSRVQRKYPVFLDTFGQPILYWKADSAGVLKCDSTIGGNKSGQKIKLKERGVYHYGDNKPLVYTGDENKVLILTSAWSKSRGAAKNIHRLNFGPKNSSYNNGGPVKGPAAGFFQHYIWNQNIAARLEPHKKNSYLLISAGPDGLYGTADDIANFEHHGQ